MAGLCTPGSRRRATAKARTTTGSQREEPAEGEGPQPLNGPQGPERVAADMDRRVGGPPVVQPTSQHRRREGSTVPQQAGELECLHGKGCGDCQGKGEENEAGPRGGTLGEDSKRQ